MTNCVTYSIGPSDSAPFSSHYLSPITTHFSQPSARKHS